MENLESTDNTEETDNTIASLPEPTVPEENYCGKRNLNAENLTATGGSAVVMPLRGAMAAYAELIARRLSPGDYILPPRRGSVWLLCFPWVALTLTHGYILFIAMRF